MASDPQEPFETVYLRLEDTVARLEAGGLSLEETLSLYEEGMQLAGRCRQMLTDAELRVTRLQETYSASLERFGLSREASPEYAIGEDEEELPLG